MLILLWSLTVVTKDLVCVCLPVSWAQGSSYLAMLLEPVVVYYIIAEVGCQGGLLAMAAGKPRERCEKLEPSCQKLKSPQWPSFFPQVPTS